MKAKTIRLVHPLDEANQRQLQSWALRLWEEMAGDLFSAIAEEKGKSIDDVLISRSDVLELVMDAGRLHQLAERAGNKEIVDFLESAPTAAIEKVLLPVFRYQRYGM